MSCTNRRGEKYFPNQLFTLYVIAWYKMHLAINGRLGVLIIFQTFNAILFYPSHLNHNSYSLKPNFLCCLTRGKIMVLKNIQNG